MYAHEWVRANLREIVNLYKFRDNIKVDDYQGGLPPCCYEDSELETNGHLPGHWEEESSIGSMIHAFPKVMFTKPSWARVLEEPQYVMFMSDGDLNMLKDLRRGMGMGRMALNRNNIESNICACAYHRLGTIRKMCDRYIGLSYAAKTFGKRGYNVSGSHLLDGVKKYHNIFGDLVDECMNTDSRGIGEQAWRMVLRKATLIGMVEFAAHLDKYHNPVHGLQGPWGRWNQVQEGALQNQPDTGPKVVYGTASTSNGLEGRMNKAIKEGTGMSMGYGALTTKAQNILTTMGRALNAIQFSLVPDHQGQCEEIKHTKQSGQHDVQKTG